jgi:chaperone modulatory protein CbpM
MTPTVKRKTTVTALARVPLLDLETFARAASIHPELARRLVTLGLIEAFVGPDDEFRFARDQVAVASRLLRLRSGFALNYAALGLVADLLDRIAELERASRTFPKNAFPKNASSKNGGQRWT